MMFSKINEVLYYFSGTDLLETLIVVKFTINKKNLFFCHPIDRFYR